MILFYFIFRRNPTTKTYSEKFIWFLLRKSCWNVGVWFKMYTGFIFYYYTAAVLCFLTHFLLLLLPWLFYTAVLEFQRSFTVVRCFHSSNALFFFLSPETKKNRFGQVWQQKKHTCICIRFCFVCFLFVLVFFFLISCVSNYIEIKLPIYNSCRWHRNNKTWRQEMRWDENKWSCKCE